MKKLLCYIFLFSTTPLIIQAQSHQDSLIDLGIKYYAEKNYNKAIEFYKKALEIDHKSVLANYELSLAYTDLKEYKEALKYSNKVIKLQQKHKYLLAAYLIKGSALDNLGKTKASIQVYEKALRKLGTHYLLYYNMALSTYNLHELKKSEQYLMKAISQNPVHANSHYLLGALKYKQKERIKSLLSLYFFLLTEPNTLRSQEALTLLEQQLTYNTLQNKQSNTSEYLLTTASSKGQFAKANHRLSRLIIQNTNEKNKPKTPPQLFYENTAAFFSILEEIQKKAAGKEGIWWKIYIDFFAELSRQHHTEAYCYYIAQTSNNPEIKQWLLENTAKMENFKQWLEKRKKSQ